MKIKMFPVLLALAVSLNSAHLHAGEIQASEKMIKGSEVLQAAFEMADFKAREAAMQGIVDAKNVLIDEAIKPIVIGPNDREVLIFEGYRKTKNSDGSVTIEGYQVTGNSTGTSIKHSFQNIALNGTETTFYTVTALDFLTGHLTFTRVEPDGHTSAVVKRPGELDYRGFVHAMQGEIGDAQANYAQTKEDKDKLASESKKVEPFKTAGYIFQSGNISIGIGDGFAQIQQITPFSLGNIITYQFDFNSAAVSVISSSGNKSILNPDDRGYYEAHLNSFTIVKQALDAAVSAEDQTKLKGLYGRLEVLSTDGFILDRNGMRVESNAQRVLINGVVPEVDTNKIYGFDFVTGAISVKAPYPYGDYVVFPGPPDPAVFFMEYDALLFNLFSSLDEALRNCQSVEEMNKINILKGRIGSTYPAFSVAYNVNFSAGRVRMSKTQNFMQYHGLPGAFSDTFQLNLLTGRLAHETSFDPGSPGYNQQLNLFIAKLNGDKMRLMNSIGSAEFPVRGPWDTYYYNERLRGYDEMIQTVQRFLTTPLSSVKRTRKEDDFFLS